MQGAFRGFVTICILAWIAIFLVNRLESAENQRVPPLQVRLTYSCEEGQRFFVDQQSVSADQLLYLISERLLVGEQKPEFEVLATKRVRLMDLSWIRALAQKAGYMSVKFYIIDEERHLRTEVSIPMIGEKY